MNPRFPFIRYGFHKVSFSYNQKVKSMLMLKFKVVGHTAFQVLWTDTTMQAFYESRGHYPAVAAAVKQTAKPWALWALSRWIKKQANDWARFQADITVYELWCTIAAYAIMYRQTCRNPDSLIKEKYVACWTKHQKHQKHHASILRALHASWCQL